MPEEPRKPTLAEVLLGSKGRIPPPDKKPVPDSRAESEKRDLDSERKAEEIDGLRQDRGQRGKLGWCIFWLVVAWLVFVGYTVWAAGFHWWGFTLTDTVIVTLLGTTTANILGVLLAVTGYLFPKRQ